MHLPATRPDCFTASATVRAPGFWDRGQACGNGIATLKHTPPCEGCARLSRAVAIAAGDVAADEPVRSA